MNESGVYINEVLGEREQSWGTPKPTVGFRTMTGIYHLDQATKGIKLRSGGIYAIQGIEGTRKTTILLNIVINQCLSGTLPPGYTIEWDSLESGMPVEKLADMMVSIVANRFITYWHYTGTKEADYRKLATLIPEQANPTELILGPTENNKRINIIKPEFLEEEMSRWSMVQGEAISLARRYVATFPIIICGLSEDEERERRDKKSTLTDDIKVSEERWHYNADKRGVRQVIVDHISNYVVDGVFDEYRAMTQSIPAMKRWQKRWAGGLHWIIAQIGTGQRTAFRNTDEAMPTAAGGPLLARETNAIWNVKYNPKKTPYFVIFDMFKTRIGYHHPLAIPIEPESGAMIGKSRLLSQVGELQ